jgi:hypothetical protein
MGEDRDSQGLTMGLLVPDGECLDEAIVKAWL